MGANAILSVSLAVAHAAAAARGISLWRYVAEGGPVSLPVPMLNILNGGRHASDSADIQEFMVLPVGVGTFSDALRAGAEIYQSLRFLLRAAGHSLNVGDEGGFAPSLLFQQGSAGNGVDGGGKRRLYAPGREVFLGLDVAATELYRHGIGEVRAGAGRRYPGLGSR